MRISKNMFKKEAEQKCLFWPVDWLSYSGLFLHGGLWNFSFFFCISFLICQEGGVTNPNPVQYSCTINEIRSSFILKMTTGHDVHRSPVARLWRMLQQHFFIFLWSLNVSCWLWQFLTLRSWCCFDVWHFTTNKIQFHPAKHASDCPANEINW